MIHPVPCCCDRAPEIVVGTGTFKWFLSGSTGGAPVLDVLSRRDGSVLQNNVALDGELLRTCGGNYLYVAKLTNVIPDPSIIRKYDGSFNQVWSHSWDATTRPPRLPNDGGLDSNLELSSVVAEFADADSEGNVCYCGQTHPTSPNSARIVKLDSSGIEAWTTDITDGVYYWFFISCAIDLDGNVAAVGWRRNTALETDPSKLDWLVYYFDSEGNEVWHDSVPDNATDNSDNLGTYGSAVCFDNEGNLYVGYSKVGPASKTFPFVRKYSPSGSIVWTKSITATSRHTQNIHLGPASEKLIVCFDKSVVQYSDSSHSTLDWTFSWVSASNISQAEIGDDGHIYVTGVEGGSPVYWKVDGTTGLEIYSAIGSPAFLIAVIPGRHPHFI